MNNYGKTVHIGGKDIRLKATAKLPVIYEAQFGKNFMETQASLISAAMPDRNGNTNFDLSKIDYVGLCRILRSMAKAADPSLLPFDDRLDTFDQLPMSEIIEETYELLLSNLISRTQIKNTLAAAR